MKTKYLWIVLPLLILVAGCEPKEKTSEPSSSMTNAPVTPPPVATNTPPP